MTQGVYADNELCGPWLDSAYLDSCCKATRVADPPVDPALVEDLILVASTAMYYWLGRQFRGECETTFRPKVCGCGWWSEWGWDLGRHYAMYGEDSSGGGTSNGCACSHPSQVDLGFFPVTSINSVWMYGAAQPIGNYHLDEYRYLVANDGACFPVIQNYFAEPGDSNDVENAWVFEVSVNYGQPVPHLAKRAAARLACELIKDCMDLPCALPPRTINVVRQGISQQIVSAQDMIQSGLIGILEIDLALKAYNPSQLQSPSFVWSPDLRQGGRRTYT